MLRTHDRLGDFEIVRLLGKGGMGEVYEAQQLNPSRRVALKVLAPWLADNEEALERFWREAAVPAQLDHPGIVRIISCGKTDEGIAYYTMQLIRGVSLARLMKGAATPLPDTVSHAPTTSQAAEAPATPGAGLPSPQPSGAEAVPPLVEEYGTDRYGVTARLGAQVARALTDAHRRGFLHRDIKPSNVMVDQHGHVYLLDFGLTRLLRPGGSGTCPGVVLGTPWYMSPEQARGEPLDQRSDLYSLGVTLYQLATGGQGPFTARPTDSEAVLVQVRAGTQQPLSELAPDVPRDLARIIVRAVNPDRHRRYQSAEELVADLEAFVEQTTPSKAGARAARRRRRPLLLGGAATLLAGLLFAGLFLVGHLFQGGEPPGGGAPAPPPAAATQAPDNGDAPPYPDILRNRPWRYALPLLNQDSQPLWHRRLNGGGKFVPAEAQLLLYSPRGQGLTLLALDDDPARRWFEFAVDVNTPFGKVGGGRAGIFFGWRPNAERFFFVEVDERATNVSPEGRATIGVIRLHRGKGAEGDTIHTMDLPGDKGTIPLARRGLGHHLVVRAVDHCVTVTVDGQARVFDRDGLARTSPRLAELDARGAVGIWAWDSPFVGFRNITLTALPGESGKQ